jgi:predicted flap endonuclease-1-like 5' DNA nuclease
VSAASLKKETAKISLPAAAKTVPQATMNLKKAAPAAAAPTEKKSAPTEAAAINVAAGKADNSDLILGIAATVVALASLGIQLWTMLS